MKRGPLLAATGVLVVAVGLTAGWFYSWSKKTAAKQRLADLHQEVMTETSRRPVDVEACRSLLRKLTRAPGRADPRLVRGRAELMLLLDMPTQQALDVLEMQLTGSDATPEDRLLGARILERRHAETGEASQAFRGARLAEQHCRDTGQPGSLRTAWLLSFRAGDEDGMARIETTLANDFGGSVPARLVAALSGFYRGYLRNRAVDEATVRKLAALDREIESAPPELTIALASRDIDGSIEQVQSALDRLEALVKSYRSSVLARELLAIGHAKLRTVDGCEQSLFHLDWLLNNHPENGAVEVWRNLRSAVRRELERLRKGAKPVK